MILNEQKHPWCWRERVFYLYTNGLVEELTHLYSKNGYNYYKLPKIKRPIVCRIICKSKVDTVMTVQTGKITYKK